MLNKKLLNNIAVIAASYTKRWMEGGVYDKLLQTDFAKKVKGMDKKFVYGIEFGLNYLTSLLDQKMPEDTTLKKFIKEIGMDAASEISKRLINGSKGNATVDASDNVNLKE